MLSANLANRVRRLIPLLASDIDGEALATRNAIGRELAAGGSDWHSLAASIGGTDCRPTPSPRRNAPASFGDLARACRDLDAGQLTPRERAFVSQMCAMGFVRQPSQGQRSWLQAIFARLQPRAAA